MTAHSLVIPDAKRSGTQSLFVTNLPLGPGSALRSGRDDNWEFAR